MSPRERLRLEVALLLVSVFAGSASAQGEEAQSNQPQGASDAPVGLLQLRVVNDTFAGADRRYSSHLELGGVGALPGRLQGQHLLLRGGQVMYTSRNIQRTEAPTRDHPFGAWLYADVGAILRRPRGVAMVRLRLGALGERAFAEPVQDGMHRLLGVRARRRPRTGLSPRSEPFEEEVPFREVRQLGGEGLYRMQQIAARITAEHAVTQSTSTTHSRTRAFAHGAARRLGDTV